MGVVDDLRKLLQDLVTPDLHAQAVELRALREETNRRFDETNRDMTRRFEETNRAIAESRGEAKAGVDYVVSQFQLHQRVSRLEEERPPKNPSGSQ